MRAEGDREIVIGGQDAPAAEPSPATATLCAGRAGADLEFCASLCGAWPAAPDCLIVRRWGAAGANVLIRHGQRDEPWDAAAKAEGFDADRSELLRVHADYALVVPGPWFAYPEVNPARARRAEAGHAALERGTALIGRGDADAAQAAFGEAAAAFAEAYGPAHLVVALALGNRGHTLTRLHRYDDARAHLERALAIRRGAYPPRHPAIALAELELAATDEGLGQLQQAAQRLARAHAALDVVLGADDPMTLTAANNLSVVLSDLGRLEESLALQERVIAGRRTTLGPDAEPTRLTEMNRASSLLDLGRHDEARAALGELVQALEATNPRHGLLGAALHNLGRAHQAAGDLDAARGTLQRAVVLLRAQAGAARDAATARVGLADVLRALGDVGAAMVLYREALDVRSAMLGPLHPDTGAVWARIGDLLLAAGMLDEAKEHAEAALAIAFKDQRSPVALGTRHAGYAQVLQRRGDAAGAREHFERARTLLTEALGADHTNLVAVEAGLASALVDTGALAEARPLLERAVARLAETRGAGAASVIVANHNLALLYWGLGERKRAVDLAARVAREGWARFEALVAAAPNPVAHHAALQELRPILELERDLQIASGNTEQAFAAALRVHGAGARGERLWRALHVAGVGERDAAAARAALAPAKTSLCAALKADGGALALFAAAADLRAVAAPGQPARVVPRRAGAFVLSPRGCRARWVDLGDEAAQVAAVEAWRRGLEGAQACYQKRGDPAFCVADLRRGDEAGATLREAAWDPVAAALGATRRVWLVADGALTRVAFDALPAPDGAGGAYLIDDWELAYAAGPEAVVTAAGGARGAGAFVAGDLDYTGTLTSAVARGAWQRCAGGRCERAADRTGPAGAVATVADAGAGLRVGAAPCGYDAVWPSLGDTEAKRVAATLGGLAELGETWLVTGRAGDEAAVRGALTGKRVLHLATHGFFASPQRCGIHAVSGGEGASTAGLARRIAEGSHEALIDPLRLSGVALSGANADRGEGRGPLSDGVLSAREVASLDLRGTELVALSACETGLGVAVTGESFSGLVGSFLSAGAERALVSLWQVPSEETTELFEDFYRRYAMGGDAKPLATFREARRALARRLAEEGVTHSAFFWGAFVPVTGVAGGF